MSVQFRLDTAFQSLDAKWSSKNDALVEAAIEKYNQDHFKEFPKDPFSSMPFCELKRRYLVGFNKSAKQIRDRWVTHICSKIKSLSVLPEDRDLLLKLHEKYPRKWSVISQETFKAFHQEAYYSDNAIKNFFVGIENCLVVAEKAKKVFKRVRFKEDSPEILSNHKDDRNLMVSDSLGQNQGVPEAIECFYPDCETAEWGYFVDPSEESYDYTIEIQNQDGVQPSTFQQQAVEDKYDILGVAKIAALLF